MKKILLQCKGLQIYVQLPNEFNIRVSANELKATLKAMISEGHDLEREIHCQITGKLIFINFNKTH